MTTKEIETLLSQKSGAPVKDALPAPLRADVTRHAACLRKRAKDRRQTLICVLAALIFLGLSAVLAAALMRARQPQAILQPVIFSVLGFMAVLLLCAPVIAWFSDEQERSEMC